MIKPYYETSDTLFNQVVDQRLEYEEVDKNISEIISQQESEEGRKYDLPKIEESHRDILFTDWDMQLKKEERAKNRAYDIMRNIIEVVNDSIHSINRIKE